MFFGWRGSRGLELPAMLLLQPFAAVSARRKIFKQVFAEHGASIAPCANNISFLTGRSGAGLFRRAFA
jgi:hypothetical protein